jgi:hypothetical protein
MTYERRACLQFVNSNHLEHVCGATMVEVNFQAGFQASASKKGGFEASPSIEWGGFEACLPLIEWGLFAMA